MSRAMIVLVLAGCVASPDGRPADDALALTPFSRVVRAWAPDGKRIFILQEASTVYVSADGARTVTLVAMVHLGTPEYFRSIESTLRDADAIWVEGVTLGAGSEAYSTDCPEPLKPLDHLYALLEEVSGLSNQKDWEDVVRDGRWKNADANVDQLDAVYASTGTAGWEAFNQSLKRNLAWLRSMKEGGVSDEERRNLRLTLLVGQRSSLSDEESWAAMQAQREQTAWETIRTGLPAGGRHTILFGAAHCPALETRLVEAGYVRRTATWHDAFAVEEGR